MVGAEQSTTLAGRFPDICGRRTSDYITGAKAGTKAVLRLVMRACQAWVKLTTHGAFVTITVSLATEFPG